MRKSITLLAPTLFAACLPTAAADLPAARLVVKPLLCVTDRDVPVCSMKFSIRWATPLPSTA